MTEQPSPLDTPQSVSLVLEVMPEDERNADPALVEAVRSDTLNALRTAGATIEHEYSGRRGVSADVITGLTAVAINAWAQKEIILADTSALVTIFTPVVLIARHLRAAYEKRAGKDVTQQAPIKITVEIDGAPPISVEAATLETAETALHLARRFQQQHPAVAAKVTSQSKAKTIARVPRSQPRKRR